MLSWLSSSLLKSKIQNDPYYRFQSMAEIKIAADLGIQIDVNQAAVDDWLRFPGLSIHQAKTLTQISEFGVQFLCIEDVAAALGLSVQRLKPLEPIMKFCYYDPESLHQIQRVNLNTATVNDLTQIPEIRSVLARAIVRNRQIRGEYKNLVDLQQRLSLPSEMIANLMHYLRF
ncbi:MAG: ComEA family DNA-binding protein [Leptolyngbya sp. UWPOB_LEPTO1]|uniref:ComEA family DNA-binding protein n=1 Tax=Leptolyngbya sp. UWPOB_LEPTO1 TaxID=2815653 RepID=UPI001AD579C6|nr:ComEA family DNA-binding protein [Leptolyngbya sp. UWPOB_LEPTO1]MBN8559392.1 ComEA family DNA-binding protein [Leptolyngbya sp. UWPOB_LEPTO1]